MHGKSIATAFRETRIDDLLARCVIVFCTFIPLFAFRELQRVLGDDKFRALFFWENEAPKPDLSGKVEGDCVACGVARSPDYT